MEGELKLICNRCGRQLNNFEQAWSHAYRYHPSLAYKLLLPYLRGNHSERRRYQTEEELAP